MKAADFEKLFDDGEDITPYLDWSTARRPNQEPQGSGRSPVPHGEGEGWGHHALAPGGRDTLQARQARHHRGGGRRHRQAGSQPCLRR